MYSETLKKLGFKINPYGRCIVNKHINGKQCNIVFYVDDNKISHVDKDVVSAVINNISKHFGDLAVTRGNKHDFLGMDIEIKDKMVHVGMEGQIMEAIEWGEMQLGKKPVTPASSNLFNECGSSQLLPSIRRIFSIP